MKIWRREDFPHFFWMGHRLAFDLQEVSHNPAVLSRPGFWAVTTTFEGEWTCARFNEVVEAPFPKEFPKWALAKGDWASTFSEDDYKNYVGEIRDRISEGLVYQVNACRELSIPWNDESLAPLMAELLKFNPAPYSSYLNLPEVEIASASPELFFLLENRLVTTGPIKGTKSLEEQDSNFGQKDIAENVMIVDLMRNDLGKICETGSITVPQLLQTQNHPGLSHLVSYVRGRIRPEVTWRDISDALLPPGSVSGAPKLSAVTTIIEKEGGKRGPYCGALGWVDGADALLSVAIRIFWSERDGILRFGTGAGITWGSVAQEEWDETELKAVRLISIAGGTAVVN